jgi:S-adenosylmethionine decarboxylase
MKLNAPRSLGRHLLIELYGCPASLLNDLDFLREAMLGAARDCRATIVTDVFHRFQPHGLSGVVVVAESHLAVHTWPEHGCASVDVFSCGATMQPERVQFYLKERLQAASTSLLEVARGLPPEECPGIVNTIPVKPSISV